MFRMVSFSYPLFYAFLNSSNLKFFSKLLSVKSSWYFLGFQGFFDRSQLPYLIAKSPGKPHKKMKWVSVMKSSDLLNLYERETIKGPALPYPNQPIHTCATRKDFNFPNAPTTTQRVGLLLDQFSHWLLSKFSAKIKY